MNRVQLTAAATIFTAISGASWAEDAPESVPKTSVANMAENFTAGVQFIDTEAVCLTLNTPPDPIVGNFLNNVNTLMGAPCLNGVVNVESLLHYSFDGATACEVEDALSIARINISRQINDIDSLLQQASKTVIAQGYVNPDELNEAIAKRAEAILGEEPISENTTIARNQERYRNADTLEIDKHEMVISQMRRLTSPSGEYASFSAQVALYDSALNQWLMENNATTTQELKELRNKLEDTLDFIGTSEKVSEAQRIAEAGCSIEQENPTTQAGVVTLKALKTEARKLVP